MLGILGVIPVIAPIVNGIVKAWGKSQDVKYKVDGKVKVAHIEASTETLRIFAADNFVCFCRDVLLLFGTLWTGLTIWDKIVGKNFPNLVWGTLPFPEGSGLSMFPYAVLTFLFGVTAMQSYKSRWQ